MPSPHRVAVVGYGVAGSAFHAPIIEAVPGLELAAIVTANPDRARAAADRYPRAVVVDSMANLWGLELDAVTVATPNSTHVPLARECLDHGLHVVVDKPLAPSAAEGRLLNDLAARMGLLLTVYLNRRWDADFLTIADLVASGALGDVARFESRFERWRPRVAGGWKESAGPGQGGGILFDLGPHLVDQAWQLFGPVDSVYAEVDRTRAGAVNPDDVFVALTHRSGVRSHLFMSAVAADLGPRFRILGTGGGYSVYGLDGQEAALRDGRAPDARTPWGEVPRDRWGTFTDSGGTRPVAALHGDYPQFYRRWAAALSGEGPVPVDPADAITGLEILEAAGRSSQEACVVGPAPPQ